MSPLGLDQEPPTSRVEHAEVVGAELAVLERALDRLDLPPRPPRHWIALRLLEQEPTTVARLAATPGGLELTAQAAAAASRVREQLGVDPALVIADARYGFAHDVAGAVVHRETVPRSRTDRLDDVLTHRLVGMPLFLVAMWVVFTLVVGVSAPVIGWIEEVVEGPLTRGGGALLGGIGLGGSWIEGLLLDGLLAGIGAVLVFLPVLAVLYLALGLLEDSGYMSRAAYLMDRVMTPLGLSGKSVLPLLLGFGCNVPGVYATRVLDRRRDRVITSLLLPFVSCAARLPVFVLLAGVFFARLSGTVVFGMYLLSIATVLVLGAVLDRLLLTDERDGSFILELPPYRRPSPRVLATYVGQRVGAFLRGAGPVILVGSMIVWALLATPVTGGGSFNDTDLDDSAFAATSAVVAPVLRPAGLGSWEVTGTLVSGIVAKELMVATFWQVFAPDAARAAEGATGLAGPLRAGLEEASGGHGAAAALALMVFVLLYVPCLATVGAIRQELGGRWALVSIAMSLGVAWLGATAVFQAGRLLALLMAGG